MFQITSLLFFFLLIFYIPVISNFFFVLKLDARIQMHDFFYLPVISLIIYSILWQNFS